MVATWRSGCLAVVLAVVASTSVHANPNSTWNQINRKLGLGWSDGYHAHNGHGGECDWVPHPTGVAKQVHVAPASAPFASPPPRSAQASRSGPVLPSQRSQPRPTYWYR